VIHNPKPSTEIQTSRTEKTSGNTQAGAVTDACGDRPDEDGIIMKQPTWVRQLLGESTWEKRLADLIMATGVGLLGSELRDFEADGW
jgi:hypothetical protein